jgi:hypothetical protein
MDIFRWRRFPPATPRISRWKCAVLTVRSGILPECLSTRPVYHEGARESNQRVPPSADGSVFLPGLKAWSFLRRSL